MLAVPCYHVEGLNDCFIKKLSIKENGMFKFGMQSFRQPQW